MTNFIVVLDKISWVALIVHCYQVGFDGYLCHTISTFFLFSLFLFSGCVKSSDCPKGGQNYECLANVCNCKPRHVLVGDICVGMFPKYIWHT